MKTCVMPCYKEPTSGIVHLKMPYEFCGGEYTFCGDAFDRPFTEDGEESMVDSNDVCNCEKCILMARSFLPYLKEQVKRINKRDKK